MIRATTFVALAGDGGTDVTLFDPWGNPGPEGPTWNRYRWNGGWGYLFFPDLSLYYVHGRWWNADTGLFLSPNEKGDYMYGGDGPPAQDPINNVLIQIGNALAGPWSTFPNDFCLPDNLGCWGGSNYGDWLKNHYNRVPAQDAPPIPICSAHPDQCPSVQPYGQPSNKYDLTAWLIDEMRTDASGPYAAAIADTSRHDPILHKAGAYALFYQFVKAGSFLDFKPEIQDRFGDNIMLAGDWYLWDVPANIAFGYVGRAAGFQWWELTGGAGYAQVHDNLLRPLQTDIIDPLLARKQPNWEHFNAQRQSVGSWDCSFDDCADEAAISVGEDLWDEYGLNIDADKFAAILRQYKSQLHQGAAQPIGP